MRANIILLGIISAFFYLCAAVYTVWHLGTYDQVEWTGTLGMALTGVLATLIGFYLMLVYRGQKGEMAADRPDAELDDDDPEMGHFAPWSWWPIGLAAAIALVFVGFAGPTFLFPIGGSLLAITMIGWVYEHYRGNFVR